jgi:polysaccharide export outer membrane protein
MKKFIWAIIVVIPFLLQSCNTYKNIPYFQDIPDTLKGSLAIQTAAFSQPRIHSDDILSILVQSIDPNATAIFNRDTKTASSITSATPSAFSGNTIAQQTPALSSLQPNLVTGYLVNKQGQIEMPLLGKVAMDGLTTDQAADTIKKLLDPYFKDLIVDVRFANFKITILGEVLRPATYTVPNERITLFDALGLAGDLTVYGKRENVLLVRDSAGHKQAMRLNLTSKGIMESPYFYLKQNDVIYVEPNKQKMASLDANRTRNLVLAASFMTLLIAFFTYTKH